MLSLNHTNFGNAPAPYYREPDSYRVGSPSYYDWLNHDPFGGSGGGTWDDIDYSNSGGGYDGGGHSLPPINAYGYTNTPALIEACRNRCAPNPFNQNGLTCTCGTATTAVTPTPTETACRCSTGTSHIKSDGSCECVGASDLLPRADDLPLINPIVNFNVVEWIKTNPLISAGAVAGVLYLLLGSSKK